MLWQVSTEMGLRCHIDI